MGYFQMVGLLLKKLTLCNNNIYAKLKSFSIKKYIFG
jgi:hypothetical protein